MKLHSLHIVFFVLQAHDKVILVAGSNFQVRRKILVGNYPAMVTTHLDGCRVIL